MSAAGPRILFVTAEYAPTPGGIGDYTARLAGALRAAGARPAILTGRQPSAGDMAPGDDLPIWRLAPDWGPAAYAAVERAAAAWRADVVHIQYQTGAYGLRPSINALPWWLRRRRPRPAVAATFHDRRVPYLFPKAGRLRAAANVALARGSDLVIATNPADYAWLARHARRAALIPIGPNIEPAPETDAVAARLRAEAALGAGEALLVTFGLLNHSKGLPTLLRALARLNEAAERPGYRLALVGAGQGGLDPTDRQTATALARLAAELGVASSIIRTGQLPATEVAGWLRAADAVVLPYVDGASYRRGTLLAALACGAAVVTTHPATETVAALPPAAVGNEQPTLPALRSGVHALLVPPDDPAALAAAIAATAGDPWLARGLRRGALEIAAHFTWPAIAARTLAAYAALREPCR